MRPVLTIDARSFHINSIKFESQILTPGSLTSILLLSSCLEKIIISIIEVTPWIYCSKTHPNNVLTIVEYSKYKSSNLSMLSPIF